MWRPSFSDQESSLEDVYCWYKTQEELLLANEEMALNGLVATFLHLTRKDVVSHFAKLRLELCFAASLLLFSSFEAALMVDFAKRGQHGRRWPNGEIKDYLKSAGDDRPSFYDIIQQWKALLGVVQNVRRVKSLLNVANECRKFRNWLAHGRYYKRKDGAKDYDPVYLYALFREMLDLLKVIVPENLVYWKQ